MVDQKGLNEIGFQQAMPHSCLRKKQVKLKLPPPKERPVTHQNLWYTVYCCTKQLFLPTIHAQEVEGNADIKFTTVERLENARPQVLITPEEVKEYLKQESGVERLKEMFTKKNDSELSDDVDVIIQLTRNCGFTVFLFTSLLGGNAARERFVEKNKHKVYATRFQAFRAYNDAIVFGSLRFGFKWGLKSAIFTGLFMTTAQMISVYRNKSSFVEYTAAGAITCALLRMTVGLRGMFAGAVIGSALGLVGGGCICAIMYATDNTQQQRHYSTIEQMLRANRESQQLSSRQTLTSG